MSRRTIGRRIELSGTGLHSGQASRVSLAPGRPGMGIVFRRLDTADRREIPARLDRVAHTERRTAIGTGADRVDTVEHLLAVVAASGIVDLDIEVHGSEVPILDGSFAPFARALGDAGLNESGTGRTFTGRLDRALEFVEGSAEYRAEPCEALRLDVELLYEAPVIGRQAAGGTVEWEWFTREIAPARTFGFLAEVASLRGRGLLAGAAEDCAIVLAEDRPLNTTLRWPNEFARHKLGDLLGDLSLMGFRPHARISAFRPSHRGNIAFARTLAAACGLTEE